MGIELELIDYIYKNFNIPIFFVCTRARTEEYSLCFKEEIKINLIQNFGITTKLIKHIYSCHLLDEKDGIYKRFGIDKLLNGIKEYFLKEINVLKSTNFMNKIISKNNDNSKEKYNLSILSSLEESNSFKNYLQNLCENIIEKYKIKIYKLDKNHIRKKN